MYKVGNDQVEDLILAAHVLLRAELHCAMTDRESNCDARDLLRHKYLEVSAGLRLLTAGYRVAKSPTDKFFGETW